MPAWYEIAAGFVKVDIKIDISPCQKARYAIY